MNHAPNISDFLRLCLIFLTLMFGSALWFFRFLDFGLLDSDSTC